MGDLVEPCGCAGVGRCRVVGVETVEAKKKGGQDALDGELYVAG